MCFDWPKVALQRIRENIHERNHFRLWLAPIMFRGHTVWIGQISRDIGVRFTMKTITTHKIDPDVDETRASLIQDFLWAQALEVFGFAGGVGEISIENPRGNLTGDIFFTDGRRAVMLLSEDPVDYGHIGQFTWHRSFSAEPSAEEDAATGER
mgnify:CR=1 FL=1